MEQADRLLPRSPLTIALTLLAFACAATPYWLLANGVLNYPTLGPPADDAVALLVTWFLLTLAAIGSVGGCGARILVALVCCFPIPFVLPILACALGCGA